MSYELMIKYISLAEKELKQKSKPIRVKKYEEKKISASLIANLIRQQISLRPDKKIDHKIVYFHKPTFLE
jgi:rhamnose utilization protein RhaD (predicted bifunctional aldolase and dehydrogenase)